MLQQLQLPQSEYRDVSKSSIPKESAKFVMFSFLHVRGGGGGRDPEMDKNMPFNSMNSNQNISSKRKKLYQSLKMFSGNMPQNPSTYL